MHDEMDRNGWEFKVCDRGSKEIPVDISKGLLQITFFGDISLLLRFCMIYTISYKNNNIVRRAPTKNFFHKRSIKMLRVWDDWQEL